MKYLSLQLKGENKIVNTIWKRNERCLHGSEFLARLSINH